MNGKIASQSVTDEFRNWMPTRIVNQNKEAFVDWCFMGDARFTQPFFEDTISHQGRRSSRQQTSLETLGEFYKSCPGIQPTGFIFHLSRCGSTLISQMLAASPENIVISEAPPLDFIIRAADENFRISHSQQIDYLKWLINAFGQKRFETEKYFFVKFDSWHTLELDLINEVFPQVPWIFLYRNPVEIIVSQMRQKGLQMIPGKIKNLLLDLNFNDILQIPAEEYCARILGRICQSALENINTGQTLLINYSELPDIVFSRVFEHFNITYRKETMEKMKAVTQFNAKTPQIFFEPDIQRKREEANLQANLAAEKFVLPFYQELENIRLNRSKF